MSETIRPLILGCRGEALTYAERRALAEIQPWGLIVFADNCVNPGQLYHLCQDFRDAVGRKAPVLIDQEGGRIQRLVPPQWPLYPETAAYGRLYGEDPQRAILAAGLAGRLIAADLVACGLTATAAPVLDIPIEGADPVIGTRAFATEAMIVSALARSFYNGLLDGGILPIIKHIPGHGRALCDSHDSLPVVEADTVLLAATDFVPFHDFNDAPAGMTAHVVFSALDADRPVTLSAPALGYIRDIIGFDGLLMSDDLRMGALAAFGSSADNAATALAAGCDLALDGRSDPNRWERLADAVPLLEGKPYRRAEAALSAILPVMDDFDEVAKRREFEQIMLLSHEA